MAIEPKNEVQKSDDLAKSEERERQAAAQRAQGNRPQADFGRRDPAQPGLDAKRDEGPQTRVPDGKPTGQKNDTDAMRFHPQSDIDIKELVEVLRRMNLTAPRSTVGQMTPGLSRHFKDPERRG